MNKYQIMEEISKLSLKDTSDLSDWLTDRVINQINDDFDETVRKITRML